MNEKEKELKAFNQCADALNALEKKSILKVFQLLSIHFEFMPSNEIKQNTSNETIYSETKQTADILLQNEEEKVKSTYTQKKQKKSNSHKVPTYLSDFDFRPTNAESLKDFYLKFTVSSNLENNLVFLYYYQEILKVDEVSTNHIFSAYRHLGLKIPSFPQTLNDTKRLKGWIDTSNSHDLKLTRAGINFLEHDMIKGNGE